ncbi:MAG TPA: MBL fold metallo-hydrolase [Syntrophales bacterium]|nr:MBL fold metallo-hydrolase [Syntrophales bacterium]HPO34735.1 MBL fold metallo-hydrolase [Syntrophales bacterium]
MPSFHVQLINDPFGDPGVYLEFTYRRQAIIFDLGDLRPLHPRKILKASYVFVSHTHMDHFIGFDHLLRLSLGRNREVHLFGPPNFIGHVRHKLMAYTWNLVEEYTNDFILKVTELTPQHTLATSIFSCRQAFKEERGKEVPFDGIITENKQFFVRATCLDHRIPTLAFSMEERYRLSIMQNVLNEMGLATGPWLNELKEHILVGSPPDTPLSVRWKEEAIRKGEEKLPLGYLQERIVKRAPGRKVAYVTDCAYTEENRRKIVELVRGADILFIEAAFLNEDREKAKLRGHLTAAQAGEIAREARVKRIVLFHFSPKYKCRADAFQKEALSAFAR